MGPLSTITLSYVGTKLSFFCSQHVLGAFLDQLVDVNGIKKTGIVICDVTQLTRFSNPHVLCEQKNVSSLMMHNILASLDILRFLANQTLFSFLIFFIF